MFSVSAANDKSSSEEAVVFSFSPMVPAVSPFGRSHTSLSRVVTVESSPAAVASLSLPGVMFPSFDDEETLDGEPSSVVVGVPVDDCGTFSDTIV